MRMIRENLGPLQQQKQEGFEPAEVESGSDDDWLRRNIKNS